MRKTAFGAIVAAAMGVAVSAQAADLGYRRAEPYAVQPQVYSWVGPYIGANLGYGWGDITNNPTRPSGLLGGLQAGYNWQNGAWVFGLEGDVQISGADDTFAPWKFSNPWFGTARGRVGYAFNNVLVYGTGGLAFGEVSGQNFFLTENHGTIGWTAGGGVEMALNRNWSAKAEYLYVDLSDKNFTITGLPNGYQFGVIRLGVNYHF
ncbi:MAG: outer membrane protein [Pseudomonadota bacterium]